MPIRPETVKALVEFDTPTIANAIELFHVRSRTVGYTDARIKAHFSDLPPMVGFAATCTFRGAAPAPASNVYCSIDEYVESFAALPGPVVAVVQDLDDPPTAATFGDGICSMYRSFGGVGLISSGAGRDLEQIREMRFPVFSNGLICAHGYTHILHSREPVRIGGLTVHHGDLLHGDGNGVVAIPTAIADELPQVAAEFLEAERVRIAFLQADRPKTIADCAANRDEFRAIINKIVERVRRDQ